MPELFGGFGGRVLLKLTPVLNGDAGIAIRLHGSLL